MPVAGQLSLQGEAIRGMIGEANLLGELAQTATGTATNQKSKMNRLELVPTGWLDVGVLRWVRERMHSSGMGDGHVKRLGGLWKRFNGWGPRLYLSILGNIIISCCYLK